MFLRNSLKNIIFEALSLRERSIPRRAHRSDELIKVQEKVIAMTKKNAMRKKNTNTTKKNAVMKKNATMTKNTVIKMKSMILFKPFLKGVLAIGLLLPFYSYAQDGSGKATVAQSGPTVKPIGPTGPGVSEDRSEVVGALVGMKKNESPKSIKLDFEVERMTLPNGMMFLLHSQQSIPLVSYHTWFRVGAKDELPGESGLAHMFEHMMFKGTPRYPNKDFDRILQANGIVNNAFTNQDYTGYYEILPSSKLELIMDMESDRLLNLSIVDEEFQKEREVVKEERRMRYDNNPGGMGWEKLNSLIFKGAKYEWPVIGTMKEINEFDVEKLRRFYKKWYIPSNAVVVIVGDFDVASTKKLITKFYGSLPSPPRPTRQPIVMPSPVKKMEDKIAFPVNSPEILWGVRTVKGGVDDAYALDLLNSILGQGKSSHLFQELVYRKQTALSVESGNYTMQDSGILYIQAVAKPGVTSNQLKGYLENEIAIFLKTPLKEESLNKAKNMVLSDYVESLKTNDGKAKLLAMNEILFGDYKEFFRDIDRYLKVTLDDLNRVKSYLNSEGRIYIAVDAPAKEKK